MTGIGLGAGSAIYGVGHGIAGVVYEPYKGAKKGFVGGMVGLGKGLGGLVYRPLKGAGLMFAQPVAGLCNTPKYIAKSFKR